MKVSTESFKETDFQSLAEFKEYSDEKIRPGMQQISSAGYQHISS